MEFHVIRIAHTRHVMQNMNAVQRYMYGAIAVINGIAQNVQIRFVHMKDVIHVQTMEISVAHVRHVKYIIAYAAGQTVLVRSMVVQE